MKEKENVKLSIEEINEIMERLIADETAEHREEELLCGLALLTEGYVEKKDYDAVKEQARTALEVTPTFNVAESLKIQVLKRIIKAVESTPYHHLQRELLAALVLTASQAGLRSEEYKKDAEKLIKLDILLEPDAYKQKDPELEKILASLFTSKELVDIIQCPDLGFLTVDRVEYTWYWESIASEVEERLEKILANVPKGMGFCFHYWSAKEDLLKKEYGITWNSPAVMNPRVMFD